MFDKKEFSNILKKISQQYKSQSDLSNKANVGRTYLSSYINLKCDKPPKEAILDKIAKASNGITSFKELKFLCGYLPVLDFIFVSCYKNNYDKHINNLKEIGISQDGIRIIYLTFLGEYEFPKEYIRYIAPANYKQFINILNDIEERTKEDYMKSTQSFVNDLNSLQEVLSKTSTAIDDKIKEFEDNCDI